MACKASWMWIGSTITLLTQLMLRLVPKLTMTTCITRECTADYIKVSWFLKFSLQVGRMSCACNLLLLIDNFIGRRPDVIHDQYLQYVFFFGSGMAYSAVVKIFQKSRLKQHSATLRSGSESGHSIHSSMPRTRSFTSGPTHRSWPTVKVLDGLYVSHSV
jgi:hypothetical protein